MPIRRIPSERHPFGTITITISNHSRSKGFLSEGTLWVGKASLWATVYMYLYGSFIRLYVQKIVWSVSSPRCMVTGPGLRPDL
jgi:hypothetical protein